MVVMTAAEFSEARLDRMHGNMATHVERGETPCVVTLVSRRGEVHVDAIGKRAINGDEVQRDTIFRISSMSKPVTAAATMVLVEEGALSIDQPVDRLLPELVDRTVLRRPDGPLGDVEKAKRPITVRDLLTFTMGFGIVMEAPGTYPIQIATDVLLLGQGAPAPSTPPEPDEWMRRLGTLPLIHQPGERWMYSTGADVLGVLIARASGRPFGSFLRERIFDPLGMNDTGFSVPSGKISRLATSYLVSPRTGELQVYDPAEGGQWSRPPAFPSGAGGLVSTIDDYHAFAQMLISGGKYAGGRILSKSSVEAMTTDQLTPGQKALSGQFPVTFDTRGWGFCTSVVTRMDALGPSVGSYGWDGGMGTSWYSDPKEEMIGIVMTQRMWNAPRPPDVCADFWTSAYQAIEG
jgi:CubicO group peptidase (beta-lactamase class C family)